MKSIIFTIGLMIAYLSSLAQYGNEWAFGFEAVNDSCCAYNIKFEQDTFVWYPVNRSVDLYNKIFCGAPVAFFAGGNPFNGNQSSVSIADKNGDLLLYTDGVSIYHGVTNQVITGGDSLGIMDNVCGNGDIHYGKPVYRSVHFIPKPNSPNVYYLLHPMMSTSVVDISGQGNIGTAIFNTKLLYSEIDMNVNGGAGLATCNQILLSDTLLPASTCLTKHANGVDWWLIVPHYHKNRYYCFLIDRQGIHPQPTQIIGNPQSGDWASSVETYFSQDGSLLFQAHPQKYCFMDFDRCTGILSNYRELPGLYPNKYVQWKDSTWLTHSFMNISTALSPNNRFLYLTNVSTNVNSSNPDSIFEYDFSTYNLSQYDLWATNLNASQYIIQGVDSIKGLPSAPAITPNGLILIGTNFHFPQTQFGIIKYPNLKGDSCQYISFQTGMGFTTLNIPFPQPPNYDLSALIGSPCDTLQTSGIQVSSEDRGITLYPNPTEDKITVHSTKEIGQNWELHNAMGVCVYQATQVGTTHEISLADLPQGVYVLVVRTKNNRIFTEKVRKE